MLKAEYSIGDFTIKPEEKEAYEEKAMEIAEEINKITENLAKKFNAELRG